MTQIDRRRVMAGMGAMALPLAATLPTTVPVKASAQSPQLWKADGLRGEVKTAIEGLAAHGLSPADYLDELRSGDVKSVWMKAGAHMLRGKLDPLSVEPDWTAPRRVADLETVYAKALQDGTLGSSLDSLAPKQAGYGVLMAELARVESTGASAAVDVPDGPTLKAGMSGARVEAMQARLSQLGFVASQSGRFDDATEEAVRAFQDAQGLDSDGVAGAATRAALNRTEAVKADTLRANLERWRWLPDDLGARHVRVNIAGFRVDAVADGIIERTHLAIVGKPFRKTPVFSDAFQYFVFNPWWETPNSLARRDKLPAFRRDPGTVDRLGFQVLQNGQVVDGNAIDWNAVSAERFPYRLRQAPGPTNALGEVKMMFPNAHNIYLHDTPTRGLFAQRQRAFSSGCIRTQDPLALSAWILRDTPGWDRARIDAAVASGKETRADMKTRVPVHILYNTVEVEGEGVRYLDDIYGRDAKVVAGLAARM